MLYDQLLTQQEISNYQSEYKREVSEKDISSSTSSKHRVHKLSLAPLKIAKNTSNTVSVDAAGPNSPGSPEPQSPVSPSSTSNPNSPPSKDADVDAPKLDTGMEKKMRLAREWADSIELEGEPDEVPLTHQEVSVTVDRLLKNIPWNWKPKDNGRESPDKQYISPQLLVNLSESLADWFLQHPNRSVEHIEFRVI